MKHSKLTKKGTSHVRPVSQKMSHHSEREKKSDKSSHKTSKSKGDRRPGSSTKKQQQKPNDFEKTGGESAVVPEIAASELILEKELGTGCFGTVFLGMDEFL